MKKQFFTALGFVAFGTFFSACQKEDKPDLVIPTSYTSESYDANVTVEKALRSQLTSFANYMKVGDNVANKLVSDSLDYYFSENGTTTLKSKTATYYSNLIENTWLNTLVNSSQNSYNPADGATATNGGVFVNRLLDKGGKEIMQEVEKGMYAATLYNHIVALSQGAITQETIDRMICIYGAHPNFPNTNTAANTTTPDTYIALYTARRDKNDGTGLYTKIKHQFLKLQAAVKAGADYDKEKNQALSEVKLLIEKAIMATVVNYTTGAKADLSVAFPTDAKKVGALHALSECVGFIHGFKAIPASQRRITDAQIEDLLDNLLAPIGEDATMYKFVTDSENQLSKIDAVQNSIKSIYGFSSTEMTDFGKNWISEQGR